MSKEMLVNVAQSEECRIAIVENGILEELYIERKTKQSYLGNIYKGKVVNIEPGIQAAFIDFGVGKNGFMHISDLHPKYFKKNKNTKQEKIGKRQALKERPPIQDCLKKGQDIVVQVTKEGIKSKGPTLSSYISLPGKYVVMMPWMQRLGVSHKVEDETERKRLKEILESTNPPKDVGIIIRTAAQKAQKRNIQNDVAYLGRLWKAIEKRIEKAPSPSEIYKESDLVIRTLRDVFNATVKKIYCDNKEVTSQMRDFLSMAMPRYRKRVTYYDKQTPLFYKHDVEKEINKIHSRRVELKSGGSIVIEQTEALVAIDVNSGRYRKQIDAEKTAKKINLEAAAEIMRQLKLRDLGGLIICDFIDMRNDKNRKEVERAFREAAKQDKARTKILKISSFGIIEMTRQRLRPSLQLSTSLECPNCNGTGLVKTPNSLSLEIVRKINAAASKPAVNKIVVNTSVPIANFLLNERRGQLTEIEHDSEKNISIIANPEMMGEAHEINCFDNRDSLIKA